MKTLLVMSGVRHVRYGARDREWGALGLLAQKPFAKKAVRVEGPHPIIEILSLALSIVRFLDHPTSRAADFIKTFSETNPAAGRLAHEWMASGFLAAAVDRQDPVETIIEAVLTGYNP